ncbi:MAG: hypothetical protein GJU76_07255 [Gallionella sp.]|nr:hypothetical protein [Gallionella sp.]
MASSNLERIRQFLADNQLDFISDIVPSDDEEGSLVLFIPLSRVSKSTSTARTATKTKISRIISQIKDLFDVKIEPVYVGDISNALEAGLRAAIILNFPDFISDCFVALRNNHAADVWLMPANDDTSRPAAVDRVVVDSLRAAGVSLRRLYWGGEGREEPSSMAILTQIKINAPIDVEALRQILRASDFRVPDSKWLNVSLDSLRKTGLIKRLSTARYVLTPAGLSLVPHGRSRESSDVKRILALRTKKWLE